MKVGRKISSFLLYKLWGWKVEVSFAPRDKCILCVAPHTSNIDFLWLICIMLRWAGRLLFDEERMVCMAAK